MLGLQDALNVAYICENNFVSDIFGLIFTLHGI
jgi:hypothetical protein